MIDKPSVSNWRSYVAFLKNNPQFRRFWISGVISQFGNWFNYIAVFVLLEQLTGSVQAVSWFLIAKFIPSTVLGPAAGVVADRFSRKKMMIACDVLRVGVVLCFLLVRSPELVWVVYVLALLQESLWTFANPARQASVPNLCSKEEINLANALSGATWSILLAFGASLGGLVTALAGWETAIIIDAATFVVSAVVLSSLDLPHKRLAKTDRKLSVRELTGLADMQEGGRYIVEHRKVFALILVKSGWALSGGILVMLVVFGEQVFESAGSGSGSGILYGCRGFGAAIGPIIAWRILGEESPAMMKGIAASFFVSAVAYLAFSQAPNLWVAAPFVLLGHIGGATQWVFSTSLLHRTVEDAYRGRVFAAEMALVTLGLSLSSYCTGLALDWGVNPRHIVMVLAGMFLIPGSFWQVYLRKRRRETLKG
jgi:predicted MFS family arabinose efflux permease